MNKEIEILLKKCDKCKLKQCEGCEFTHTDIQKIKKYVEELESILDKVTDKLKEDINRFDKVIKDRGIWGEQKVDFKKYKNYAINLLNIIEGEKK